MQVIGYTRVSTVEQGKSGLGLDAQRAAIEAFAAREGLTVAEWFSENESGKGHDAIERRPQLAAALKAARKLKAPLVVNKIDRLARSVHFISGLMVHKVRFVVTEIGMTANDFELHLRASFAEEEARKISERTKEALVRSTKDLGMDRFDAATIRAISKKGGEATATASLELLERIRDRIKAALDDGGSLRAAAELLNERAVPSTAGGRWHAPSLLKAAYRLGLRQRRAKPSTPA